MSPASFITVLLAAASSAATSARSGVSPILPVAMRSANTVLNAFTTLAPGTSFASSSAPEVENPRAHPPESAIGFVASTRIFPMSALGPIARTVSWTAPNGTARMTTSPNLAAPLRVPIGTRSTRRSTFAGFREPRLTSCPARVRPRARFLPTSPVPTIPTFTESPSGNGTRRKTFARRACDAFMRAVRFEGWGSFVAALREPCDGRGDRAVRRDEREGGGHRALVGGLRVPGLAARLDRRPRRADPRRGRGPPTKSGPIRGDDGAGDGEARPRGTIRGGEVRVGVRDVRGPCLGVPRRSGDRNGREAVVRPPRAPRPRAGGDAVELSVLAGLPVRGARPDGGKRRTPEAREQRHAVRARDPGGVPGGGLPGRRVPDPRPRERRGRLDRPGRSEEHTSELQSPDHLVCRLLLEKKTKNK